MRVLPMGLDSVLVEDPPVSPASWAAGLRDEAVAGVIDIVPAARTVLVRCADAAALSRAVEHFDNVMSVPVDAAVDSMVTIDVFYDGDDLAEVAAATGLSPSDVIDLHTSASYRVAFCGFAPGFAYLAGLPERLHLPRKSSPRTRVPAGSVAIAAEYSAVYPRSSPGGWHLIGHTNHILFDAERNPPAALSPGAAVRFRPAT